VSTARGTPSKYFPARRCAPQAIVALLAYTVFVGASAPVVRAAIAGILAILAWRLFEFWNAYSIIGLWPRQF
jgi:predicted membrane metal-binding protein